MKVIIKSAYLSGLIGLMLIGSVLAGFCGIDPVNLRAEYRNNPLGLDSLHPRLSWQVESEERAQVQTSHRILVASTAELLERDKGDLWDTGKVTGSQTVNVDYKGSPLSSGQVCFWKVKAWDKDSRESPWSEVATWSMGLLNSEDWKAEWISFSDKSAVHASRDTLYLPPARFYRKEFESARRVQRATLYASALGIHDLYLNGQRISDRYFAPGWSDYIQRAYYHTYDVTPFVQKGDNALGTVVADGWYAGYVGYGLLVGYGPNRSGRNFYGKTPALLVQLEIEYDDGSRETIVTDDSWRTTADGPYREADMIMGEHYDARKEMPGWSKPGFDDADWTTAIPARQNGSIPAVYYDPGGARQVELGFQKPGTMQAYAAQPIRVTRELPAQKITEPKPGVYTFDLGQNFAGIVRLKVKGTAGTQLVLRHGEMLHPDGRLMTENLRRARAIDTYVMRGDPEGETWVPRFTYHGFQFVEVTGLAAPPELEAVTGLVLNNATPMTGDFACSDEVMTRFWKNTVWTQRANFIEIPTDCPQRDERLGWMGDAQTYVRTASFNADVSAFFTKWLDDVEESQRSFGAYPDYAPYPMQHGGSGKSFGTAWTDAGIIVPWTIWKVYGDGRVVDRHWNSMTRFMEWRQAISPKFRGVAIGNGWGDWLNVNETTPIEMIDAAYYAHTAALMAEMAGATGRKLEQARYQEIFQKVKAAFNQDYVKADGSLKVDTQTAYSLAIEFDLLPAAMIGPAAGFLAQRIMDNEVRMATGFLGTKRLLPALTAGGRHDLAVRLFQSRRFPSWGYEVVNGANTVWERWDSYTVEHGFNGQNGKQNASMNSFSHYSFGAVMEWAFRDLAGIDALEPGYHQIKIQPRPPSPGSNPEVKPIHWVKASYDSIRGRIRSDWRRHEHSLELKLEIPANTTALVHLPAKSARTVREGDQPLQGHAEVKLVEEKEGNVTLEIGSGTYRFVSTLP